MSEGKKLQIANCKLQIAKWDSLFPRSAHRGISLTEVLIAMGVLTVGLLGVMAMFPVGNYYLVKADIADHGQAIARQAMSDVIARGMLDPAAWRMPVINTFPGGPPGYTADAGYGNNTYMRPLGPVMAEEMASAAYQSLPTVEQRQARLTQRFGSAYVLDPMGVAASTLPIANNLNPAIGAFPAEAFFVTSAVYGSCSAWNPWTRPSYNPNYWPVRRVTLAQANPTPAAGGPVKRMESPIAWSLFNGKDDLTFDIPQQGDRPAVQMWDATASGAPVTRQWIGDYSWMVSIAPTSNAAQLGLGTDPESYAYDVSVVVFYKRGLTSKQVASVADARSSLDDLEGRERMVKAKVVSTGLHGGEILLENTQISGASSDPFQQLRAGQWVMLCGPHPASTPEEPRFALNWYEVINIDESGTGIAQFDPKLNRVVTLRGANGLGSRIWRQATIYPTTSASASCRAQWPCIPKRSAWNPAGAELGRRLELGDRRAERRESVVAVEIEP